MEHTHSEEQTREEVGNGRDDRGGEGRRQASAGNAAAEKSGAIPPPRGVGVAADSPTSGFAATSAAEASAALPSPSGEAIDAQQHQQRQQQQKQQQKQQQRASAASSVAVEAAPETEDRVGGGGGGGGGRAAATSAPDIDHTSATTTTTATTTPTVTSGGGSRGATDAPPPNVAAHQGGARPGDSSSGIASGASTAERGEASSSHREPSHNTNVPAHQEEQPPLPATATAAVTAPTTRAMVPDKEDDDDDPAGGASAQRQHTLQNYASRDSGAVMLESSPASKGMSNLLVNSRDKYAISPCEDKQWAVLGLSEDIMVRTIRISSHEKYSSLVKDFQVLASPSYPVNEWLDLGTFTAKFVQGEQTFDLPDPAFARYLKFKFLSHYGDEFYCTVSQVKVHGTTMLESFHDDLQQSSADLREVQDYIKKKDPKPSATGIGSINGSVSHHGVGAGGASGANGGHPAAATPGVRTPHSAPVESAPASIPPSSDGGIEHRPHAASAAMVPPGDKRPIGGNGNGVGGGGGTGGGGAGAGTATVEDIVRGVPTEMVVPASTTCTGPTGTDGSCPGEVLTDRVGGGGGTVVAAAAGGGGSNTFEVDMPTMGGEADAGKPTYTAGGEGGAVAAGEVGGGGRIGQGADGLGHPIGGGEVAGSGGGRGGGVEGMASGQQKPDAAFSAGGPTGNGNVGHQAGQGLADVDGSEAPNGIGESGVAEGVGSADVPADGGAGEKQKEEAPPRKGIIHSTMEAFSKVVHRGEGTKPKDADAGKSPSGAVAGSGELGGSTAPPGSAAEGQAGAGVATPPPAASPDAGSGMGGDGAIGSGADVRLGANVGTTGCAVEEGATAAGAAAAGGGSPRLPATGHYDGDSSESQGRLPSDPAAGDPVGGATGGTAHSTGASAARDGEAREGSTTDGPYEGSGGDTRGGFAPGRPPQAGHGEGVANSDAPSVGSKAEAESVPASRSEPPAAGGGRAHAGAGGDLESGDRPEFIAGLPQGGEGTETTEGAGSAFQDAAGVNDRLQHAEWTLEVDGAGAGAGTASVPQVAVVSGTGADLSSHGGVPPGDQGGAYAGSTEGAWHAEEAHAYVDAGADEVSLVAACMDRLSFADFRDEVLTRTQQTQQAPGGGVAIGGQYESIFKTLMNKIKTLEINQSLFSLYIDDVHICYQEVIAQMLREQERARASRSELLSAQAAHLVQIGDQWPAFQELQAKVLEVENRMLLSSMAWFTSLFCLVVLVCNCFFKLFRRCVLGPHRGRDQWEGGGGGGGGRRIDRGGWTHRCASCSPLGRDAAAVFSNETPSPSLMGREWRRNSGKGGGEEDDGSAGYAAGGGGGGTPRRRLSNWAAAERVQGGDASFYSPGVSGF